MVVHTFNPTPRGQRRVPLCESEAHGTYIESFRILRTINKTLYQMGWGGGTQKLKVIRILKNASLRDPE